MLLIAGSWSIYELKSIGSSVQRILDENYQSIRAAKVMKEALEREDSAVLLLMLGHWREGRRLLSSADSLFTQKINFAFENISIEGEHEHLEEISSRYAVYKNKWERPIVDTYKEENMDWYFKEMHNSFLHVKQSINELITLNDNTMYLTASKLENRSSRAIMPGIIALISALVFTFLFNYLVNYYYVTPIITITDRVNKFINKRTPFNVAIETDDEIAELADAIDHLCQSVNVEEKQS
jgi:NtrC-family two-component system sensor histidine kinase KinB